MVNCLFGARWFGFLESPYERDCYLRVPLESQTTNPNQQLTISCLIAPKKTPTSPTPSWCVSFFAIQILWFISSKKDPNRENSRRCCFFSASLQLDHERLDMLLNPNPPAATANYEWNPGWNRLLGLVKVATGVCSSKVWWFTTFMLKSLWK